MTTQELADILRAAGVQVRSNLSSVEEKDVERVLPPLPKTADRGRAAEVEAESTSSESEGPAAKATASKATSPRPKPPPRM